MRPSPPHASASSGPSLAALALVALPLAAGLLLTPSPATAQEAADMGERVRGVTVSCQTWGWEWGSDDMVETLDELSALGANWIAIHPYARIRGDGTVIARGLDGESPEWLTRPIAEAQMRGMKIMIKPHLAYWGSPFAWRGEITFDTRVKWDRFWQDYRTWILRLAELCPDADAFVIGTELDKTLEHEVRWRELIEDVRVRTRASLTYAANWTHYQRVPFWDALDVIGIQGYFPLVSHERVPTDDELKAGWARVLARVEAYARTQGKRVVFTELGYDASQRAAVRPWESARRVRQVDPRASRDLQVRCMNVALEAIERRPAVIGAFLWKWFAGPTRGETFLASAPPVRAVIRDAWRD